MELVTVKGASIRLRKPRSLAVAEFQLLLKALGNDLSLRTLAIVAISFGLRISECLGLRWADIDWLGQTLSIERGVVKQIVDDVKSAHSAKKMAIANELLELLHQWKRTSQFPARWIGFSPRRGSWVNSHSATRMCGSRWEQPQPMLE
jgi:integrase